MNISRVDLFKYKILSMNLEVFHKEFQSVILQLIHNNLLHLSVALNISYSVLSAEFATRGSLKHLSYVSTWLFSNSLSSGWLVLTTNGFN